MAHTTRRERGTFAAAAKNLTINNCGKSFDLPFLFPTTSGASLKCGSGFLHTFSMHPRFACRFP